jgi:hypothetical protein
MLLKRQASHWKRRMRSPNTEEDEPDTGRTQKDEDEYFPPEQRLVIARERIFDGTRPKKRPWKWCLTGRL